MGKICFVLIKITRADQIKILDRKNMKNKAQYDLDRKAAKISAYSSNGLDKYEYLTGEYLGYKTSVTEQARFEYYLLGKIFSRRLKEEDKKRELLKRLGNNEGKNKEQLKAIENQKKEINGSNQKQSGRLKIIKDNQIF